MNTKNNDLTQIALIYLAIALSGFLTWKFYPTDNEIVSFFAADIVMTIVCFAFSTIKKNASVYDSYWSLIPFLFVLQWLYLNSAALNIVVYMTFLVVSIWSWRLTLNWARSWPGFEHEDWRYIDLAKKSGQFYPIVNFLGIHLFPTLLVFGGMLPLFYLFTNSLTNYYMLLFGFMVSCAGIALEFFADNQLASFRNRPTKKLEDLLNTGLWGRCRYPNYLGEMLFWIGLALVGFAYSAPWYSYIGAVAICLMIVFISIPMKEERMLARRPNFKKYQNEVPLLFPKIWK